MPRAFAPVAPVALAALLAAGFAAPALAEMSEEEMKALVLETIRENPEAVLDAIRQNPEIVMEAIETLQAREAEAQAAAASAAIAELEAALYQDPNAPVIGNPDGDVTVVEFFDYNCPYCKQAAGEVKALLAADPNIRLVYRERPILGPGSESATRAALAARAQGKYEEFHWALMEDRTRKDEAAVLRIAARLGLDVERLKADMQSAEVNEHIETSMALARELGFTGTPSFVVGREGIFGYVSRDELSAYVARAREAATE